MKIYSKLQSLVICLFLSLLLAACGEDSSSQANRPLTVWAWGAGAKALKYQATEYNRKNPGVRLQVEEFDRQTVYDRLEKALQAGGVGLPDVVLLETAHLQSFAGTFPEGFLNLSDLESRAKDFGAGQWEQSKFLGRVRALPFSRGPMGLFYRADLWERAGVKADEVQTWDDLLAASQKVQAANANLTALALDPTDFLETGLAQQGLSYFTPEDRITLAGEPAQRVATLLQKFSQARLIKKTFSEADMLNAARADEIGGAIADLEWGAALANELPKQAGQWRVMPLPALDRGGRRVVDRGGLTLAIPRTAGRADTARAFVEFFGLDQGNVLTNFTKFGLWPSFQPAYSDPVFAAPQAYWGNQAVWQPFVAGLSNAPILYFNKDYATARQAAEQATTDILVGNDPARALDQAAQRLKTQTNRELVASCRLPVASC